MKEFDFNNIGKRLPYTTPQGFFERVTDDTLQKVKGRENKSVGRAKKSGHAPIYFWFSAVAAAALLFLFVIPESGNGPVRGGATSSSDSSANVKSVEFRSAAGASEEIERLIVNMSDEDLNLLAEISLNDVFYNQQ